MPWNDEWSGLADFLANMIEKYAGEMDLDTLPDPDNYFKMKRIKGKRLICGVAIPR